MSDNKHYQKGLDKLKLNQFNEAIEHFTAAIKENSSNPFYFNCRAVCYLNIHQYDLSMFDMNKSIELDNNYAYFFSSRGFLKARMKDLEGAVSDYERSLELDPENEITYNNLGLALESMGNLKKAEKYFSEANRILGYDPSKRKLTDDGKMMEGDNAANYPQLESPRASKVAKDVFTKKSTFREFLGFIGNGFKLKESANKQKYGNDQS